MERTMYQGACLKGENTPSLPFMMAVVSKLWVTGEVETTFYLCMALDQRVVKKKKKKSQICSRNCMWPTKPNICGKGRWWVQTLNKAPHGQGQRNHKKIVARK